MEEEVLVGDAELNAIADGIGHELGGWVWV
jgi:hypothetical protein